MSAQTAGIQQPPSPETLPQFLTLLIKGIIKRLPVKLLIAGGIALAAWIIHTYLLVVTNEGFAPGANPWLDRILALQGRTITGTLVWTLAAGLVTSFIARIITFGFSNTLQSVVETPRYIWRWAGELGIWAAAFLIAGYLSAVFLGFFINNGLLIVQIMLVVIGILIARHTSIFLTILRLGWSDLQRAAKRPDPLPFNLAWPGIYLIGFLFGLLVILPNNGIWPYLCACLGFLLLVVVTVALFVRGKGGTERVIGKKLLLWLLVPALLLFLLALVPAVFADDGGWLESGGTLGGWIGSPGAARAVAMGILPAAGSGLGVLAGTALGSMLTIFGAAGVPGVGQSLRTGGRPSAPAGSRTAPPSRTADSMTESFQPQEQVGKAGPPLESRTADFQSEPFPQAGKDGPGGFPSKPDQAGVPSAPETAEGGVGLRSDRAAGDFGDSGRGSEGMGDGGTGQRDVRGVQPQTDTGPAGDQGSGAAESADRVTRLEPEPESPAAQMAERHRPDLSQETEGPLSDRNRPGGLEEAESEAARLAGRERPQGMGEQETAGSLTAGRHEPGGLAEAEAGPAEIEQPPLRAERHTPEPEGGHSPLASRHEAEDTGPLASRYEAEDTGPLASRHEAEETGPLASRHEAEGGDGPILARRAPDDDQGLSAERHSAAETFEGPAPLHSRHTSAPEENLGLPLPPVPIPGYALDWELVVVRTPEGSGVTVQERFELGERTRIGRHGAIDLKLLDLKVSRQHADIIIEGSSCRIIDLDSSNGTFVNGRRLTQPEELKHGDAIKIGDTYFVVEQRAE